MANNSKTTTEKKALPKGWVWTKLGDIRLDERFGIVPDKTPDQNFELYSVPSFQKNKPEIVSGKDIGSNKQIVEEETVLLCKINPRINRVWIVGKHCNFMKIASTEWIPFFRVEGVAPKYLRYYMTKNDFRDFLAKNASGVGGSLMRIKANTFADYPFPLPPLPEQRCIVAKIEELFTKLDAGVEALKRAKVLLKRYRQTVLKAAFEGKLTEGWRQAELQNPDSPLNKEPASVLLERIKAELKENAKGKVKELPPLKTPDLLELPEGWVWMRTSGIGEIVTGTTPSKSNKEYYGKDYPFYKPTDLNSGFYVKGSEDGLSRKGVAKARLLPAKSILITCIGATIGKTGFIRKEGASNQQINSIIPEKHFVSEFIYFMCISPQFQKNIIRNASSTTLPILNKTKFELLLLPIPTIAEQQQIVEEIERRFSVADGIEKEVDESLKQAERLRQSILKRAFAGKLVPQDPSDEPAEKLLERIEQEKQRRTQEHNSAGMAKGKKSRLAGTRDLFE